MVINLPDFNLVSSGMEIRGISPFRFAVESHFSTLNGDIKNRIGGVVGMSDPQA